MESDSPSAEDTACLEVAAAATAAAAAAAAAACIMAEADTGGEADLELLELSPQLFSSITRAGDFMSILGKAELYRLLPLNSVSWIISERGLVLLDPPPPPPAT